MNNINAGEVRVPMLDNQEPLLGHQREDARVEVIKAVVYVGLLESIASLSIIVSAAGGDATTLNIVGLGLASVFGGLLVLANSLMTLKELTGRHYEDQLVLRYITTSINTNDHQFTIPQLSLPPPSITAGHHLPRTIRPTTCFYPRHPSIYLTPLHRSQHLTTWVMAIGTRK
ncbi:uncharacterized protein LOC141626740 [Silene latifolia]|uniref:uncharacterized protein LOC141626740 n=1 Tax=Silene latifolia TaxID=37657 RepID=UPI003D76E22B